MRNVEMERSRSNSNAGVSVIVPTLNPGQNLICLLRTIHNQHYRPIEVIVVDGGSRDETLSLVGKLSSELNADDFKIKLLKEADHSDGHNHGPGNARNIGISHSLTEQILLFDDDFQLDRTDLVARVVDSLASNPFVGVMVTPKTDTWLELHVGVDDFRRDLRSNVHTFCGFQRSIIERVRFDPKLVFGEDRDLQYRMGLRPHYVNVSCSRHFVHTFEEWKEQSVWYGISYRHFLRRYWKKIDPRQFWISPILQFGWRMSSLCLFLLAVAALAFAHHLLGTALFLIALGRLLFLYHESASKKAWRFIYLFVRETYGQFWFLFGFISGLFKGERQ